MAGSPAESCLAYAAFFNRYQQSGFRVNPHASFEAEFERLAAQFDWRTRGEKYTKQLNLAIHLRGLVGTQSTLSSARSMRDYYNTVFMYVIHYHGNFAARPDLTFDDEYDRFARLMGWSSTGEAYTLHRERAMSVCEYSQPVDTRFFQQFVTQHGFSRNSAASVYQEFLRLAKHMGWEVGSQKFKVQLQQVHSMAINQMWRSPEANIKFERVAPRPISKLDPTFLDPKGPQQRPSQATVMHEVTRVANTSTKFWSTSFRANMLAWGPKTPSTRTTPTTTTTMQQSHGQPFDEWRWQGKFSGPATESLVGPTPSLFSRDTEWVPEPARLASIELVDACSKFVDIFTRLALHGGKSVSAETDITKEPVLVEVSGDAYEDGIIWDDDIDFEEDEEGIPLARKNCANMPPDPQGKDQEPFLVSIRVVGEDGITWDAIVEGGEE